MIKIGFSKHKGFAPVSWAIMACEHTDFSHVFIEFYAKSIDRHLIYHATGLGVHFLNKDKFLEHNEIIEEYSVNTTDSNQHNLIQWCVDQTGKEYSHSEICYLGLKRLCKLVDIALPKIIIDNSSAYICSELVAAALKELGYPILQEDLDMMGLIEIRQLLKELKLDENRS